MELDTLNLTKMCRTCKCISPQMHPLFPGYENPDKSSRIDEMLMACTFVLVIRGDGLPDQICQVCLEQLQNAFAFKCRVERIDADLREYAKNVKVTEIKQELQDWNFIEDEMTDSASMTGGNNNDNDHDSNTEKVTDCLENEIESSSTQVKLEDTFDIENDYLEEDSVADIQRAGSEMSDSDEDNILYTPPEITEQAMTTTNNLLPEKSRKRYETTYQRFMEWRLTNNIKSFSENVLLAYFEELSKAVKPSSLWSFYSMLKMTLNVNNNINIASYTKLIALLKRKADGFKSDKSKILTAGQIKNFIQNAPDNKYLLMKVIFIVGISGACRKQELRNIKYEHVEDTGKSLIIAISDSKTKSQRSFVVPEALYAKCKNYINLRPSGADFINLPFFINYRKGKCTKQCVGVNTIGQIPKKIAEYLGLPDAKRYTGHCFRRTSAIILADLH